MKLSIKNWKLIIEIEHGDLIEPGVVYNGDSIIIEKKAPIKLMRALKIGYKS